MHISRQTQHGTPSPNPTPAATALSASHLVAGSAGSGTGAQGGSGGGRRSLRGGGGGGLDWRYFVAGSISAGLSHGYTTPIDVVKTRMQTNPELYNGSVALAVRPAWSKWPSWWAAAGHHYLLRLHLKA